MPGDPAEQLGVGANKLDFGRGYREALLLHRLHKENPGKRFHSASPHAVCPNMKATTLEKVLWSLEDMVHEIQVPEEIRRRALGCIERMLA